MLSPSTSLRASSDCEMSTSIQTNLPASIWARNVSRVCFSCVLVLKSSETIVNSGSIASMRGCEVPVIASSVIGGILLKIPDVRARTEQIVRPACEGQRMDQPRFLLTQGDAVAWLRTLPAASVDLVITDPPYESLEKHRAIGTTTRLKHSKASSNDWFSIFPNSRFPELFAEIWRVLKKDTHFYLFCDPETMFVAKPMAEAAGFKFWKPLIWDKQRIGMGYHYRARYECVLFFEKGKRKLRDLGIADIIQAPR